MREHRAICMQGLVLLIVSLGLIPFAIVLGKGLPVLMPSIILAAILGF